MSGKDTPPAEEPAWFKTVSAKLCSIENKVTQINCEITEVKKLAEFAQETANEALKHADEARKCLQTVQQTNESLRKENEVLKARVVQIEGQSRRNNLLFDGVNEQGSETWEKTESIIRNILRDKMNIVNADEIKFERVHRKPFKADNKPRTIIAKFCYYKQREEVWRARTKLSKSKLWISEDYTPEVAQARRILFPIYRLASVQPGVTSTALTQNKMYINGKMYTVETLSQLPDHLKPENLCNRRDPNEKVTIFFRKESLLSNFNTSMDLVIGGNTYNCVEQFYQYKKACHFNAEVIANKILLEKEPRMQKKLGDGVQGGRAETEGWTRIGEQVMQQAVTAKMQQNQLAREALLATKDDSIGEASQDRFWGIGMALHNKNATKRSLWTGENKLGLIMEKVRKSLTQK